MKKAFYIGLAGLVFIEFLAMYLLMNMPGARGLDSVKLAYFLEVYEWYLRIPFLLMVAVGAIGALSANRKWLPVSAVLAATATIWLFDYRMTADYLFDEPALVSFKPRGFNKLDESAVVVGVVHNGEAKAYPIKYLAYHHQVRDTVGGKPVMVTYCTLCRSVRVNEPVVNGKLDEFRLVGANRLNSIYEDASTKSWWMQLTGEAEAGPQEGQTLPPVEFVEVTLGKWFEMHPGAVVMEPDALSASHYASQSGEDRAGGVPIETGASPWQDDSWVVGIEAGQQTKAYGWRLLKEKRVINDEIGDKPIVLVLGKDEQSIVAFERLGRAQAVSLLANDTLTVGGNSYDFSGNNLTRSSGRLNRIAASRVSWRCWRDFHPDTLQDMPAATGKPDSGPRG